MRSSFACIVPLALACASAGCASSDSKQPPQPDASAVDAARDAQDSDAQDGAIEGPRFPCTDATAVSSGLERCEPTGYLRRVGAASCAERARRFGPRSIFPEMDQCTSDSQCEDVARGFCGKREGGNTLECIGGCETDADCAEGRVCYCSDDTGEPFGRCVPASCDSAADCEPGYECVLNEAQPGCPSMRFECQTPSDSCGSGIDCYGFSPNPTFCVWGGAAFGCSITQCTQP